MLGLLAAISIGFSILIPAQVIASGPAAPGGPYPYGRGPGGINVAPGSGVRSTTPLSVTPEVTHTREARRHKLKRPRPAQTRYRRVKTRKAKARH